MPHAQRGCRRIPPIARVEGKAPDISKYRFESFRMVGMRSGGRDVLPAKKTSAASLPQAQCKAVKADLVWWPSDTASDRQRVMIGKPFERKGEILIVGRTANGYLTHYIWDRYRGRLGQ